MIAHINGANCIVMSMVSIPLTSCLSPECKEDAMPTDRKTPAGFLRGNPEMGRSLPSHSAQIRKKRQFRAAGGDAAPWRYRGAGAARNPASACA